MQTVFGQSTSFITVTADRNPALAGEVVHFRLLVTSDDPGLPTGSVTLSRTDGANSITLGSAFLSRGAAVIPVSNVPAGTNILYGTYGGDADPSGATSKASSEVVTAETP